MEQYKIYFPKFEREMQRYVYSTVKFLSFQHGFSLKGGVPQRVRLAPAKHTSKRSISLVKVSSPALILRMSLFRFVRRRKKEITLHIVLCAQ